MHAGRGAARRSIVLNAQNPHIKVQAELSLHQEPKFLDAQLGRNGWHGPTPLNVR